MLLPLWLGPLSLPQSQPAAQTATGFLYKTLTLDNQTYAYCVYVPPDYTPDRAWPVILFLHGSGERGDDGLLQTDVGLGHALRKNWRQIPAIVVMPQCPARQTWVGPMSRMALWCLEETSHEYHLDPQRVYLTGMSLGGQGAWYIAASLPDRFAAVLVVCGFVELGQSTGEAAKLAQRLTDVPIWVFHGEQDTSVPVEQARIMVEAIRKAGGHVEFTTYKDGTHFIWDRVYENRETWRWLFEQKRGAAGQGAAVPQ
jgi:predicted peptidase